MNLQTFSSQANWLQATIAAISHVHSSSVTPRIALSGGSTPDPLYQAMQKLPYMDHIHFYQVDERYVTRERKQSNYHLIMTTLHPKHFFYFDTSLTIDKSLVKYQSELPAQFDLIILGLGPDGHIASLFPHSPALTTTAPVAHTTTDQFEVKDRLTITFSTIMASKHLLLLLRGEDKQPIMEDLLYSSKSTSDFPVKKLLEHENLTIHYGKW